LRVDTAAWKRDLPAMRQHFQTFGAKFPQALWDEFADLENRLADA
jgi:GTP-dependent phosphoenolpyruvate carboxykinase